MFRIGYRTLKTALGTGLAIAVAQALQLDYFTSAGIITILCIQKTRRKSFHMSWARFLACVIGFIYAVLLFETLGYYPWTVILLLLLFIPTTVLLKAQEGIVTSTVVIMHVYISSSFSVHLVWNELLLVTIGIGCALLMNAYMPSVERELKEMQGELEALYAKIFQQLAAYIKHGDSEWDGKEITEAAALLQSAKNKSLQNLENQILRYEDQYYHYFIMREKQLETIERMLPFLTSIEIQVKQGQMLADFLLELSEGVHPENTAYVFIEKLEALLETFKEMPLPTTREEFEARSSLFHLIHEIDQYLVIKQQFKPLRKYSLWR
nr:aromatic acid exporter family protein [Evansella caseinilytica]